MLALREAVRHPSRLLAEHGHDRAMRRTGSAAGLILLALGVAAVYFMLPEIRRYIRMERM